MQVNAKRMQGDILTVQRPKIVGATQSKLLVYAKDGKIPPTLIPDVGDISKALGNRRKAYFVYTYDGRNFILGNEVYCSD